MTKLLMVLQTAMLIAVCAKATTHIITVDNYQFSPNLVNANVGDLIIWQWQGGTHTTTSVSVPVGADSWNESMNAGSRTFELELKVAGTYTYECLPHSPDMAGSIQVGGALPVKFGDLLITTNRLSQPTLSWQAFGEENITHYTIQRSTDLTHYAEVGKVLAKGTNNGSTHYSFTDDQLQTTDRFVYYYLAAHENTGRMALSAIRLFRNDLVPVKIIRRISPNPLPPATQLTIQFNAEKKGKGILRIIQPGGQMLTQTELFAVPGLNNAHLHLGHHHHLPSGKYTLILTVNGRTETMLFMVL